jgi:hypothetical protein
MRPVRDERLATRVAAAVPQGRPGLRRSRPRCDRPGHRACAHIRDPRARVDPAGGLWPEGRSQRLAAGGGEGRSRRVSLDAGAGARDEPYAVGAPDPAAAAGPGVADLENYVGVREPLCVIGHQGALSRDAHLCLLAERYGVALTTMQEAAQELAHSADTEI